MGTLLLNQIKKQASYFLQEKYKSARMALTDVTAAELLAEEATNSDPWGPDAKTMTKISEASFYLDDYWRIVYVLHKRLDSIDWKNWRQSYKSLVLLEFLLTHGPQDFAEEFQCDSDVIEELGTFRHVDEKGFDWGVNMQKRSDKVLELLGGGEALRVARLKALKITKEIQGFGSTTSSPSSACSSSDSSRASSFGTNYSTWTDITDQIDKFESRLMHAKENNNNNNNNLIDDNYAEGGGIQGDNNKKNIMMSSFEFPSSEDETKFNRLHLWDCPPIKENGSLLLESEGEEEEEEDDDDGGDDDEHEKADGFINGICSKLAAGITSPSRRATPHKFPFLRSLSDAGKVTKDRLSRQFSLGF